MHLQMSKAVPLDKKVAEDALSGDAAMKNAQKTLGVMAASMLACMEKKSIADVWDCLQQHAPSAVTIKHTFKRSRHAQLMSQPAYSTSV